MSFVVPTARMVETPPRSSTSMKKTTPQKARDKGKGRAVDQPSPPNLRPKGKEVTDFLAEVDRTETARDRADPDFVSDGPSTTPRKRRSGPRTETEPAAKKAKLRTRHIPYDSCKTEDARRDRDRYIARIQENWKIPVDQWIPKVMMPSRKTTMKKGKYQLQVLDPKDWNGRPLAELSYLSGVTANSNDKAYKALQNAVSPKGRGAAGPQLLEADVQYAIQICKEANAGDRVAAPADVVAEDAEEIDVQHTLTDASAGMGLDDTMHVPRPRSPTFVADDTVVKQEPRPKVTRIDNSTAGWDGLEEVERLEELKLIKEAKACEAEAEAAELAHFLQSKRVRELTRLHGKSKQDAILLRSHEDGE